MKIHPLTVCREKLQNNDFITTNYRKKAEMLEDIIAEEEELRNFAAEIYFEISNKILVRNSKRRKVLDCLKKLNLEYNYTSYVTDFDEINTMLEQFENRCQQLLGKKNDFSDAIENDYLNSRNILRNSIMDDTDIYNSISTVNPRIYEKMKWYLEGELRNNTETNSDIEIKVIGHESEQLTKLLENRIQMYFGDFSSNKVTRKTQIIVVDQRNDLDKIEEAIANIEADNYIVMAFNANKESWIYSTKIKSEVIQMLDQFMCCSEKKVRFSDAFCAVAANYMVLMLMDSLSGYRKMFNTYCINSSLEIKNKSFYGLKLGADAFRKVKEDYVRIDESVTEAEALNRFIVKSKDIIDMNFKYEFKNDGNINRVITRVKDKEVIEAEGKNELLLDAAKESVTETIIKLFQSYGVKVSLALGFDEIKRLFASEKSVYAFDDKGIFSKEGVLIFRVD